jgi:chromosome partitioning protein
MNTIAITNQKGGIGKTVTACTLAAVLAERGFRVLAIDLDPQSNLTARAGVTVPLGAVTITDVLLQKRPIADCVVRSRQGFDVAPANDLLEELDQDTTSRDLWVRDLRKSLEAVNDRYDYCLIDTAPCVSLRFLIVSALLAATSGVIIPFSLNADAIVGMQKLRARVDQLLPENPSLRVLACLPVRVRDIRVQTALLSEIRANLRGLVVGEPVMQHADFDKAELYRSNVLEIAPNGTGAASYRAFADLVIAAAPVHQPITAALGV